MAHTYAQLHDLSTEQLVRNYDALAESTHVGLAFYRDELMRREFAVQNRRVESMTRWMTWMTGAVLVLTAANVVLVWISIK